MLSAHSAFCHGTIVAPKFKNKRATVSQADKATSPLQSLSQTPPHAHAQTQATSLHLPDTDATLFSISKNLSRKCDCKITVLVYPAWSPLLTFRVLRQSAAGEPAPLIFLNPLAFTLNAAVNVGLPQEARVSSFKDAEPEVRWQESKHLPHGGGGNLKNATPHP